ncbi:MAG: hypothetical protein ABJN34_08080 [Litoreibacter sp.]|uniref:hypothetical protein n=1 Tax=Litoreibacter sp. TaxID=1969459 RepID=UPI003299AECB
MSISLAEKARHNRLIALRAVHIRKSGSGPVILPPCADHEAEQNVFSSHLASNPMHTSFAVI